MGSFKLFQSVEIAKNVADIRPEAAFLYLV